MHHTSLVPKLWIVSVCCSVEWQCNGMTTKPRELPIHKEMYISNDDHTITYDWPSQHGSANEWVANVFCISHSPADKRIICNDNERHICFKYIHAEGAYEKGFQNYINLCPFAMIRYTLMCILCVSWFRFALQNKQFLLNVSITHHHHPQPMSLKPARL